MACTERHAGQTHSPSVRSSPSASAGPWIRQARPVNAGKEWYYSGILAGFNLGGDLVFAHYQVDEWVGYANQDENLITFHDRRSRTILLVAFTVPDNAAKEPLVLQGKAWLLPLRGETTIPFEKLETWLATSGPGLSEQSSAQPFEGLVNVTFSGGLVLKLVFRDLKLAMRHPDQEYLRGEVDRLQREVQERKAAAANSAYALQTQHLLDTIDRLKEASAAQEPATLDGEARGFWVPTKPSRHIDLP